jgi:hypothetical protein
MATGWRGDGFNRGVEGVVEQRGQPGDGRRVDSHDLDLPVDPELVEAHPSAQQVANRGAAARPDGLHERADTHRVYLHPLPRQPHQ